MHTVWRLTKNTKVFIRLKNFLLPLLLEGGGGGGGGGADFGAGDEKKAFFWGLA